MIAPESAWHFDDRAENVAAFAGTGLREFTKGGFVKGGLAIRHVFNVHITNGT